MSPSRRIAAAAAASSAERVSRDRARLRRLRERAAPDGGPRSRSTGAGPRSHRLEPRAPSRSSRSAASGAPGLGPRDEDRDEVAEGRVAERLASLELAREEPATSWLTACRERRSRRAGRSARDASRGVATAAPRELGHELERSLLGSEVGQREAGVGVDDRCERDARALMSLRDHLRADRTARSALANRSSTSRTAPAARDVRVEAEPLELGHVLSRAPSRAAASPRRSARARPTRTRGSAAARAPRTRSGGSGAPVAVQRQRNVAVRAAARDAARATVDRRCDAPPVEEEDRPAAVLDDLAERAEQRRRQRIASLAAEIDEPHGGIGAPIRAGSDESPQPRPALRPRRRATRRPRRRPRAPPAWRRPCARRSAGRIPACRPCRAPRRRRSARRRASARTPPSAAPTTIRASPRATGRARRAVPPPRAGVQDRDRVAEPLPEAPDRLRSERDLGHEHDRPEPALERGGAGLEVDLGLPAAGRAFEEDMLADALVERRDDRARRLPAAQP